MTPMLPPRYDWGCWNRRRSGRRRELHRTSLLPWNLPGWNPVRLEVRSNELVHLVGMRNGRHVAGAVDGLAARVGDGRGQALANAPARLARALAGHDEGRQRELGEIADARRLVEDGVEVERHFAQARSHRGTL